MAMLVVKKNILIFSLTFSIKFNACNITGKVGAKSDASFLVLKKEPDSLIFHKFFNFLLSVETIKSSICLLFLQH